MNPTNVPQREIQLQAVQPDSPLWKDFINLSVDYIIANWPDVIENTTVEEFKGPVDMIEMFAGALEELKQFIHGEFRALREELKEWRKT